MLLNNWLKLSLLVWLSLGWVASAGAQAVVAGNGYIDLTGFTNFTPSPAIGSRFLWVPAKSALRFGYFSAPLDLALIGYNSIAGGRDAKATGSDSIAFGESAQTDGYGAVAIGSSTWASGELGTALGALSWAVERSVTIGYGAFTYSPGAVAIGSGYAGASGSASINGSADGEGSTAIGAGSWAGATNSFAAGYTWARSYGGAAVGMLNLALTKDGAEPDPFAPGANDPVFEVGNGRVTWEGIEQKNALTVYRDGTVRLSKAAGGISMGQFN
jgi:hypothetical protein